MVAQLVRLSLALELSGLGWSTPRARRSTMQSVGMLGSALLLSISLMWWGRTIPLDVWGPLSVIGAAIVTLSLWVFSFLDQPGVHPGPRHFALTALSEREITTGVVWAQIARSESLASMILLIGMVVAWSRDLALTFIAFGAALIGFVTLTIGAVFFRALREYASPSKTPLRMLVTGLTIGALAIPALLVVVTLDWEQYGQEFVRRTADIAGWTPWGAWAEAPDAWVRGDFVGMLISFLVSLGYFALMCWVWAALVRRMLVTTVKPFRPRPASGLGVFSAFSPSPRGVLSAKSITYWRVDSRYWVNAVSVILAPAAVVAPLLIGGMPPEWAFLIPVPLMSLLLGFSLHNDVSYDHTALWIPVSAHVRGIDDRLARSLPVLFVGIAVVGMGSALSIAASGDWRLLPAVMGISLGLLLSSIGVANFWSVRWPYPAVKPGDSAFNQPQTAGTPAIPAQISAMLLPVLFVLPAVVLAVVGVVSALPPLTIVAAIVGIVSGAVVFFAFTAVSVQHWDRNGPELLEAAERA